MPFALPASQWQLRTTPATPIEKRGSLFVEAHQPGPWVRTRLRPTWGEACVRELQEPTGFCRYRAWRRSVHGTQRFRGPAVRRQRRAAANECGANKHSANCQRRQQVGLPRAALDCRNARQELPLRHGLGRLMGLCEYDRQPQKARARSPHRGAQYLRQRVALRRRGRRNDGRFRKWVVGNSAARARREGLLRDERLHQAVRPRQRPADARVGKREQKRSVQPALCVGQRLDAFCGDAESGPGVAAGYRLHDARHAARSEDESASAQWRQELEARRSRLLLDR